MQWKKSDSLLLDFGIHVVDALSRKSLHMSTLIVRELDLILQFRDLSLVCKVTAKSVRLGMLKITSSLLDEIRGPIELLNSKAEFVSLVFVEKGHKSILSSMKKEVVEFVYSCLVFRKVKIEHKKPSRK
ncbi:hypothetical protein CR513_27375, partial [Mucuna pruriens]